MNSSSDRPMCEMTWMLAASVTHRNPSGPIAKPASRYASSSGCRMTWAATATTHAAMMHVAMSVTRLCSTRDFLRCGVGVTSGRI